MNWQERVGAALAAQQEAAATPAAAAPGGALSTTSREGAALARQQEPTGEHPFAEALRLLQPVSARLDRLENQKQVLQAAAASHYTDEGVQQLAAWMRQHNVTDPQVAMAAFEKASPRPTMVEGGSRHFSDQRPATPADIGFDLLLRGDYESFLRVSIPAALAEVRGR
jgi:hypothetical protein